MKILNQTVQGQIGLTKVENEWLTRDEVDKIIEIKIASGAICLQE